MSKKFFIALGVLLAFFVGYGVSSKAWPGVPDREARYGYFQNRYDPSGEDVLLGGIHSDNATQFINDVLGHLNGPCCRQRTGAEFIIHTMIGSPANARHRPPTQAQIDDWMRRVRFAEVTGRVNWNIVINYSVNSYFQNDWNDAGYFYNNGASDSIVFYNPDGSIAYALRRICANPLGDTNGLPPAPDFRFDGESYIDGVDRSNPASPYVTGRKNLLVHPGDTVNFFHFVWNWGTGGGWTRYHAWRHPRNTTPTPSAQWQTAPGMPSAPFRANPGDIFLNPGQNELVNWNGFQIPANAAVGSTYCQHIGFFWTAWDKPYATDKLDRQACAEVTYKYNLIPTATVDRPVATVGEEVVFSFRVQNQGPTVSRPTDWATNVRTVPPGTSPLPAQDNGPIRLPFDDSSVRTGQITYTAGFHPIDNGSAGGAMTKTITINGQPGEKVCASGGLGNTNGLSTASPSITVRYSAETCVVIAKSPYVHFMGNDAWAGGGFSGACNNAAKIQTVAKTLDDGSVAGSAVEYAGFAQGRIINFGTANKALVDAAGPFGKTLTFSNFDSNNLGNYSVPPLRHCINDYVAKYDSLPATPGGAFDVAARSSGTWHYSGNISLGGAMPAGVTQIYLVDGDVTITGNLPYPSNYNGLQQLPSLIVIAKGNITVQSDVTQMDGLFVTRGNFTTCNPPPGNLSVSICNNQLVVNGAVVANRLNLLRTHGADGTDNTQRKRPAEVFNFNAEMYLRNGLTGNNSNILRTVDQKDLPPRF